MRPTILLLALALAPAPLSADDLESGFRNPPPEARLRCYWWWLNGNVTRDSITRDLEQMKAKGFGGAIVVDAGGAEQRGNDQVPAGPLFGGPEWRALFGHALATADRLGLELSLNIVSGWNVGGPMVTPDYAAKLVTWSAARAAGPARFDRELAMPPAKLGYYRDIAVVAYPLRHGAAFAGKDGRRPIRQLDLKAVFKEAGFSTPETTPLLDDVPETAGEEDARASDVVDLTSKMAAGGRLAWDVPAGEWEILRFGYTASGAVVSTSSGKWQGLVIDYLDHTALETYWRQAVDPILAEAKPYLGKALKYLVTDSWEVGGVNWTPRFRDEFRKRRGYEIAPYLPVFTGRIIESREASNRFLNDLRKTIGDLVAEEHYEAFARMAAKYGLGIHPESGGPHGAPVDSLRVLGISAFPQMEFWARSPTHRVADSDRFFVKEASSAAHIYGKRFVAAEGLTSIGPQWEETIWDNLKPTYDRALCEGLNLLVWHTFTSSPKELGVPGQEYFAGTHLNPNITWWEQAGPWFQYIGRSSYLLQRGRFVADVLYYYGDHVPDFVRLKPSDPAHVQPGYDYDAINEDALLTRASVKGGRIVLPDGTSYRVLALQDRPNISPAVLRKVRDLVRAGATVVGPRPDRATGLDPRGDLEIRELAGELWRDCGRGPAVCDTSARQALAAAGIPPDAEFAGVPEGAMVDYIHRQDNGTDIYFVSSQHPREMDITATFRVAGKAPEFWDAATGGISHAAEYSGAAGRTAVPLHLDPYGSIFVVFRKPAGSAVPSRTGAVSKPRAIDVAAPWTVHFPKGWGAPESTTFATLRSYTESSDPGIRYFSGTATYETTFELPGGARSVHIDLGDVRVIAEVLVNGKSAGIVWKPPFDAGITALVRPGRNRLEVKVTNLWPNRLIGDAGLPQAERRTWTNIRKFTKDSPLMPSGLLGPVRIYVHDER